MIAFRHCDSRFPFLWTSASQPAARWHADGEGPVNYLADTPDGAWAEFIRHEGITDPFDLTLVRRSLWAVELPEDGYARPALPPAVLTGSLDSYAACRAEATRLRSTGVEHMEAPSAALVSGAARGWVASPNVQPAPKPRDGKVLVLFGRHPECVGWPAVEAGSPPERILELVRHL